MSGYIKPFGTKFLPPVKQMVQHCLFPNGVKYDFETGFGTHKKPTYDLLIKEIARKGDSKTIMVGVIRSNWNTIRGELIVMDKIVRRSKEMGILHIAQ